MTNVFRIQHDLIETYRQDFSKYAPYTDKRSLNQALRSMARECGNCWRSGHFRITALEV